MFAIEYHHENPAAEGFFYQVRECQPLKDWAVILKVP
jgi:hypothetical protein